MKESVKERRLRLWKIRQEQEGYDVSKVRTLEQAENFFKKKNPPRLKPDEQPKSESPETADLKKEQKDSSEADTLEGEPKIEAEPEAEPKPEETSEAEPEAEGNEDE